MKLLEQKLPIKRIVVMVQKEVAERMVPNQAIRFTALVRLGPVLYEAPDAF